jgi:hypothetical protein
MAKITMCDPPSGWKYGFPRPIPQEVLDEMTKSHETNSSTNTFIAWLVSCDYPQNLIESFGDHFYCRHWEEENE